MSRYVVVPEGLVPVEDLSDEYVNLTDAQTVTGVKTFVNGIICDNQADADNLETIILRGGKTTQYKRYLDFQKIDGQTAHRVGSNAGNQFILYDNQALGTHILIANPSSTGGELQLNAQASGPVNINKEANSSNGGVGIYSGGATPVRWAQIDGTGFRIFLAGVEKMRFTQSGNLGVRTIDHGGAVGSIGLADAATVPSTNPVGGGVLYSEGGALKWRGSAGTVTVVAPA